MAAIYESGLYTDSNETFKIASKDSLPKFKCYHSFHLGNFFEQTDFFFSYSEYNTNYVIEKIEGHCHLVNILPIVFKSAAL